jgi:hypothetical protein
LSSRRPWLAAIAALPLAAGLPCLPAKSAEPTLVEDRALLTATVETVDLAARAVLLRSPTGAVATVLAGPEVRNLAQLRPGDRVIVEYYRAVAVQLGAPGAAPEPVQDSAAYRAALGQRPGFVGHDALRMRVTVVAVEGAGSSVTFLDPAQTPHTVAVQAEAMRDFVKALKPGDQVDVAYVEALAVSIAPAER